MNGSKQNFTRTPNDFLEHLARLKTPIQSFQCLLVIIRLTWGYNRRSVEIRNKYFVEATGLGKTNVVRALKKLEDMNLIKVTSIDNKRAKTYRINFKYELSKPNGKKLPIGIPTVTSSDNPKLPKAITKVTSRDNSIPFKPTKDKGLQEPKENLKKNIKKNIKKGDTTSPDKKESGEGIAFHKKKEANRLESKLAKNIKSRIENKKLTPNEREKRIAELRKQGEKIIKDYPTKGGGGGNFNRMKNE